MTLIRCYSELAANKSLERAPPSFGVIPQFFSVFSLRFLAS